jgi:hypothetical protein
MLPQRAISSNVRPHPAQMPDAITQTLMQGDEIIALH